MALTRLQVFTRATLAALVVTIGGGWLLRWMLCALSDELASGRHAMALSLGQLVLLPLTFALTWWRLRARGGTPPPTLGGHVLRAVLVAGATWVVAGVIVAVAFGRTGLSPPPGATEVFAALAGWRWFRRQRPAAPRTASLAAGAPVDTVWGTILAGTLGLLVALPAFVAAWLVWRGTPYAYAPFIVAALAGWLVYRIVMHLDHIGVVRSPGQILLGVLGGLAAVVVEDAVADVAGGIVDQVTSDDS